ncbi:hypothetical protein FVER53590_13682 [Fusarium verticillioides]|nr:hypothetical protein FVER53590_13682 [Fusarium verticillioides]
MSSLDWLLDLCAVAKTSGSGIITDDTPLENQLPPSKDPWYSASEEWESRKPGDVLRIRSALNLVRILEGSAAVYHILYRSTDSQDCPSWAVTTLFIPISLYQSPSGKAAILSYQFAYNTCNVDSSPSFALSGVMARREPNLGIKSSTSLTLHLAQVPKRAVRLDALRAVHNVLSLGDNSGFNAAIWGYSEGSIATFVAAELQRSYAPELNISAAVVGGLVDDISAAMDKINKSPIAGTLIALLLGITAQCPAERAYLESRLIPETKDGFMSTVNTELTQNVAKYSGQDIYAFFKGGGEDLRAPVLRELYHKQAKLGYRETPKMPMFLYKAIQDQFCPIELTDATVDRLCEKRAEITFERNTVGSHVSEIANGKPRAFRFLKSIFDESYQSHASKRNVMDVTVDVSSQNK